MAEPLTDFQSPGFFSQIQETPDLLLLPGSVRVVGLIGRGKSTKSILQEGLTRDDTAGNVVELLANSSASIDRIYSNSIYRYPISSYSSSITGSVAAGAGYAIATLTLKLSVNGGATQTVTFVGPDPVSLANVVVQINAAATGVKAQSVGGHLRIISGDGVTGDGGAKIQILNGTANLVLGFTDNQVSQELNWSASIVSVDPNVRPLDTEDYYVDYNTPKVATDFSPKTYFSLASVQAAYGTASVANSISLGALAAFQNGASVVTCRQLDPEYLDLSAEMTASLTDLEREQVWVIVPMDTDESLWPLYLFHASKMSSKLERKERKFVLGLDETIARIPIYGSGTTWESMMATLAPTPGSMPQKIMVANPGKALVSLPSGQIAVDGTFAAAAIAGLRCNPTYDTATPMTRKALAGIDQLLLPDLLRSEKNILTGLGVTVLEHKGALVIIRRAVTADSTSIAKQEPSIDDSMDQVAMEMREALENRFIGSKITGSTKAELEAATQTFLLRYVADELIAAFRSVKAEKNPVEPRQFDISCEILPIYPFLWGSLNLTVTLS